MRRGYTSTPSDNVDLSYPSKQGIFVLKLSYIKLLLLQVPLYNIKILQDTGKLNPVLFDATDGVPLEPAFI